MLADLSKLELEIVDTLKKLQNQWRKLTIEEEESYAEEDKIDEALDNLNTAICNAFDAHIFKKKNFNSYKVCENCGLMRQD